MTNHRPTEHAPTAIDVSGPTTAIMNSCRGLFASPSMAVMPPRKWRVIELTGKPYLRAITACDASCSSTDR